MPIRHFDFFAQERKLLQTSPLTVLKECRVGIEGHYWLRKLLVTVAKEGAPVAMGGTPLSLRAAIDKEIKEMKSQNIHPFFVFNGLSIVRKDKPFSTEDLRPAKRTNAWEQYEKGKVEQALSAWASSGSTYIPDLLHVVFDALRDHNVDFMRAPYSSWAQLAYLERHPKQYIHAILGGSEMLMYDVERLITGFDYSKGTFTWLSKRAILADLGLSDDQFLDVCIFAGFEYCATFPPLTSDLMSFTFKSTHDIIKQYKTGYNAVQSYADHAGVVKANYIDAFCRTRCAVRHHIVLTDEGRVEPLNVEYAPSDIHEFIGYRLPDEVYYYLSQNLISPQVINNLISGNLIESPPLCNGETLEYRRLLNRLLDVRTLTLALLTKELHPFFQQRKVTSIYWFEPTIEHPMPHNAIAQAFGSTPLAKWAMTQEFIQEEQKRQGSKAPIDGLFIMRATSGHSSQSRALGITPNKQGDSKLILDTKDEIVANVIGRMLELRGFLTPNHTHTPFGKALFEGSNAMESKEENSKSRSCNFHSELLTALELARLGILHSGPYSRQYCGGVGVGTEDEKKNILLIARAVSLVSVKFKGVPWTGPLSRELLLVNDLAKGLTRSLRNLCEMITLSLFLSGVVRKDRNDYFEISRSLPFLCDYSTALGIITKDYLERLVQSETEDSATGWEKAFAPNLESCEEAANAVEAKFTPWCADVKGDLKRAFKFWDQLVLSVKGLEAEKAVTEELAEEFKSADRWLAARRAF